VVVSNAIRHDGSGACFAAELAKTAYAAFDNNICLPASGVTWAAGNTLAQWRSATGFDASSSAQDPKFTSIIAPNYDLTAGTGSPLVNGGHPTYSSLTGFSGNARGTSPDVGAYEK
jgi:hypothetical protein